MPAAQLSPNNIYVTGGRTKAYNLFAKARKDIDKRVDDYMEENGILRSKRMGLLIKERAREFEGLSEEEKSSWTEKAEASSSAIQRSLGDLE